MMGGIVSVLGVVIDLAGGGAWLSFVIGGTVALLAARSTPSGSSRSSRSPSSPRSSWSRHRDRDGPGGTPRTCVPARTPGQGAPVGGAGAAAGGPDREGAGARLPRVRALVDRIPAGLLVPVVLAVATAVVVACGLGVAALVDEVLDAPGEGYPADVAISAWFAEHRSPALTTGFRAVTRLADGWVVAVAAAVAVVTAAARRRLGVGVAVAASTATAALATWLLKEAIGRDRPPLPDRLAEAAGDALPSGHAAQSIACWGAIAVAVAATTANRGLRAAAPVAAVALAIAIGASRVYLGVHWPSDVVSGWAVGLASLVTATAVAWALRRVDRPRGWWGSGT